MSISNGIMQLSSPLKHKHGTSKALASSSYVPAAGEILVATDTGELKGGNGTQTWKQLPSYNDRIAAAENSIEVLDERTNILAVDGAYNHNSFVRGKNLGSTITDEQWASIKAGTFEDMYLCDYWTIPNIAFSAYRIALSGNSDRVNLGNYKGSQIIRIIDFDYFPTYPTGHNILVCFFALYGIRLHGSNSGQGFTSTYMYTNTLHELQASFEEQLGESHIASFPNDQVSSDGELNLVDNECKVTLPPIWWACPHVDTTDIKYHPGCFLKMPAILPDNLIISEHLAGCSRNAVPNSSNFYSVWWSTPRKYVPDQYPRANTTVMPAGTKMLMTLK